MIKNFSEKIFSNRKVLIFLIIVNIAGFFVGMWTYYPKMMETPSYLWIVVVDCPLAVLLFAIVCLFIYLKVEIPKILEFFTSVSLIKFGLWTMSVVVLYWNYYLTSEVLGIFTFVFHFGMVLEGIVLIPRILPNKYNSVIIILLFLINDYFDYFLGTHAVIPPEHVGFLMIESFLASVLITPLIFIYHNKQS